MNQPYVAAIAFLTSMLLSYFMNLLLGPGFTPVHWGIGFLGGFAVYAILSADD